jgi:transcriptional regulator with XRE-family HTH domain
MQTNYISLDIEKLNKAIKGSSFKTIGNLAAKLKIHRNTVSDYLRGKTPVILPIFSQILEVLNLRAEDIFKTNIRKPSGLSEISYLLDDLAAAMPNAAFYLFGSRSRGSHREYSDYDIGVYKPNGISAREFSKLHMIVIDWNEHTMTTVQISNLNNADKIFLNNILPDLQFLTGSFSSRSQFENAIKKIT